MLEDVPADCAVAGLVLVAAELVVPDVLLQTQQLQLVPAHQLSIDTSCSSCYLTVSCVEVDSPVLTWKLAAVSPPELEEARLVTLLALLLLRPRPRAELQPTGEQQLELESWSGKAATAVTRLDTDTALLIAATWATASAASAGGDWLQCQV